MEFILEAKILSEQLGDVVCPICSYPLDHESVTHIKEKEEFTAAALEELAKNRSKQIGLDETLSTLYQELQSIETEIQKLNFDLNNIEEQIKQNLSPRIQELKTGLREFLNFEQLLNGVKFIDDQIAKLFKEKSRLEKLLQETDPRESIDLLPFSVLSELSDKIQKRLSTWNYEPYVTVVFNEHYQTFDIVINGKSRKSFGKGKRGISFTACLFGLLDYCREKERAFSNLLVLDSPITTFEEKKNTGTAEMDTLRPEVLKAFFADLANLPANSQIILFDNKQPDSTTLNAISESVFVQEFTGNEEIGRYGFFPT